METRPQQLVRRHWSFVVAYVVVTSLAVGFVLPGMMFLFLLVDRMGEHKPVYVSFHILLILLIIGGTISAVVLLIQSLTGLLVVSKDMVCQTCHKRQRMSRIPAFAARGYRIPSCCECGGDLEPAIFWKLV